MPEYRVHLVTDLPEPTEDEFDAIVERLEPVAGVASAPAGTLALTVSVSASDALVAVEHGGEFVRVVLRMLDRTASIVAVEAEPNED